MSTRLARGEPKFGTGCMRRCPRARRRRSAATSSRDSKAKAPSSNVYSEDENRYLRLQTQAWFDSNLSVLRFSRLMPSGACTIVAFSIRDGERWTQAVLVP